MAKQKVAFVGCGIMGAPIAGHILDAGYDVTVYNRTKSKTDALVEKGAHWAETPAAAAKGADVVFTMVGYPSDVEDVYFGENGIWASKRKGMYLIDLTTSSPELAKEIHDAAEVEDMVAFDCPVTGGEAGAIAGNLTLIIGATEEEVAPVLPILDAFGDKKFYFGEAGHGQTAKLCNQVSLASSMVGMADALAFAKQGGIDPELATAMISSGTGATAALSAFMPKVLAGDYKPGFLVEHFRKDIGLALEQADNLEIPLYGAQNAYMLYDALYQAGGARLGTQAVGALYTEDDALAAKLDLAKLDGSTLDEGGLEEGADE